MQEKLNLFRRDCIETESLNCSAAEFRLPFVFSEQITAGSWSQPSIANKKRKTSPGHLPEAAAKRKRSKLQLIELPTDILYSYRIELPFKDAVRTSVLSTQWKHVWCGRNKLDFSYSTVMTKSENRSCSAHERIINTQKFIKSVNSVLQQHNGVGIEQFRIRQALNSEHSNHVDEWVNYAIKSNAKELILDLRSVRFGSQTVPCDFRFQSISTKYYPYLHSLQLGFVSLRLPADFMGFPNLTKLNLEDINVTDEDAQHLLSKCNLLVSLRIAYCKMLTSLRTRHLNQLKHLHVLTCPSLQELELNCGITELDYRDPMIPLALAGCLQLTNICIKLSTKHSAVDFIFSEITNTLRHLEVLTLRCTQVQRALPRRVPKFISLHHLTLETILPPSKRKFDVLDLACLLEAALFMEKLELHMVMNRDHRQYHHEDGELRRLPSYPHRHLNMVKITGFYGQKDQLELAFHILRNATMLKEMRIETRPTVHEHGNWFIGSALNYSDGYCVATEFLRKGGHNNIVHILKYVEATVRLSY